MGTVGSHPDEHIRYFVPQRTLAGCQLGVPAARYPVDKTSSRTADFYPGGNVTSTLMSEVLIGCRSDQVINQ